MLYRIYLRLTVELLTLTPSILVISLVLLGVIGSVFSIGYWKTRMGILCEVKAARRGIHKC